MAGMSRVQRYLGAFGNGSVMKYIANLLVSIHNVAAAEAMALGMKADLDPALVYDTLADSAGTSRMFEVRGPLMRDAQYDQATATIRTHLKDVEIIGAFATACVARRRYSRPLRRLTTPVQRKASSCRIPLRFAR